MAGVNKVILIGNLGRDPEVKTIEGGRMVAKFPLATTESYKNRNGEKVETTEWHNIVMWRGLAEVAEKYLRKGSKVYIEGRIRTKSWEDKDGNKKYMTEIEATDLTMLDSRSRAEDTGSTIQHSGYQENITANTPEGDDLPF